MVVFQQSRGTTMDVRPSTRRQIITVLPLAGLGWLAACSEKTAAPAPAPAPTAQPPAATAPVPPAPAAPTVPTAPAAPPPAADAGTLPMLAETEPAAVALSYVADASRIDATKQPRYVAGQNCANCALYQAPAGSAAGPCPLFAGRRVAAAGWCSAYAKKTG
jgi:hypothetical protein